MFKKLFYVVALVALLAAASLPGGAASAHGAADGVEITRYANVTGAELAGTSPLAFKLTGSIVCDRASATTVVVGNTITIFALDIAVFDHDPVVVGPGGIIGNPTYCGAPRYGSVVVTVPGHLSSGDYIVLVNPNLVEGGAQKKFSITVP